MIQSLGFGNIGFSEMLMIGAVILLLFGARRIPELMRSLGGGLREFKKGVAEGVAQEEEPCRDQTEAK